MKNWPEPELSYLDRLNIKVTKKIYQFALKKKRNGSLLERFYMEAKHNQESIDISSSNVAQFPSDLILEEVVYYDIYPIEEIASLQKGLSKIIRKYRYPKDSIGYIIHRNDKANEYLRDTQRFKYRGGYTDAGGASFVDNSNFKCIDSVRFWISTITPSYVCLILAANPSKYFKDKFHQISKKNEELDTKITFPNIKYGLSNISNWHRFGYSNGNIINFKHRKLDELFLQANQEMVKCLRKNVKAGLAMRGPIPQVEIISTKETLDDIVTDIYEKNDVSESEKKFDEYLKYVGYSSHRLKPYINNWAYLYKVNRSRHYNLYAYQVLISLNKMDNENEDRIANRDKIKRNLYYLYPYLCISLSIQDYLRFISDEFFDLHKRISKVMEKETSKGISLVGFKKNISKTAKINWLKFQQNRLWSEITEQNTFSYLKKRMIEFMRDSYRWEDDSDSNKSFLYDLEESTTRIKKSNDSSIEFLEVANDQLLKLKNIVINTRLQYAVAVLTLLLFVITLLLIPDIWEYVLSLIK